LVRAKLAGVATPDVVALTLYCPPVAFAVAVTLASPVLEVVAVALDNVAPALDDELTA